MKGDAIKHALATSLAGMEPTQAEETAAISEAVDLALDFFAAVDRITNAVERFASVCDGSSLNIWHMNDPSDV